MDKIYFTNTLLDFKTKILPKNAIIINLEKYNKYDLLPILEKLQIYNILYENDSILPLLSNLPKKYSLSPISQNKNNHIYHDKSSSQFLKYLILSSITTFLIFNMTKFKHPILYFSILLTNLIILLITYNLLIKNQPWQNISIYN
jgi:hypothetical protein